ncbi:MAG TPA: hypothetical protein VF928_15795 [Usitatibacteraceae bacterium]
MEKFFEDYLVAQIGWFPVASFAGLDGAHSAPEIHVRVIAVDDCKPQTGAAGNLPVHIKPSKDLSAGAQSGGSWLKKSSTSPGRGGQPSTNWK